ncbi:MAG: TIGR00730 family Rossman fold protein [Acidobacteriota bacterium]|nr:TIGR00730 family Rossman fold protein [Acidobacteriota bacterium]
MSSGGEERSGRYAAVYCGSAPGNHPAFLNEAKQVGVELARAGFGMVYGGASVGLMGAVANAAMAGGAEVIGVLPKILSDSEVAHNGLTRLEIVRGMHERKARMVHLADAFLILPGGYGTLDELMEIVTWAQLKIHAKPLVLINTLGYFDGLLSFLDTAVSSGFLRDHNRALLTVARDAAEAVRRIQAQSE